MKILTLPLCLGVLVGCGGNGHDHDHDHGHEHDHEHDGGGDGGHHHEAPHGGTLIVLGDHLAHLELVHDAETGTLTCYVLDGEAENAIRLPLAELPVTLRAAGGEIPVPLKGVASALTGETAEDTSQYAGTHEALKGLTEFEAVVPALTIKGIALENVELDFPEGNEGEHAEEE